MLQHTVTTARVHANGNADVNTADFPTNQTTIAASCDTYAHVACVLGGFMLCSALVYTQGSEPMTAGHQRPPATHIPTAHHRTQHTQCTTKLRTHRMLPKTGSCGVPSSTPSRRYAPGCTLKAPS